MKFIKYAALSVALLLSGCSTVIDEIRNIEWPSAPAQTQITNSTPVAVSNAAVVVSNSTPVVTQSVVAVTNKLDAADVSNVSKDKITGKLRSAKLKNGTIYLDFTVPHWPRSGENADITMTWMCGAVHDGKVTKAHRFEHGRPSTTTRGSHLMFDDGVEHDDTVAVWACANTLNKSRVEERTNVVILEK